MRIPRRLLSVALGVLALSAGVAHAGGPLGTCNSAPLRYNPSSVPLRYDGGGNFGSRSKIQADAIVTNSLALWTNLSTATITLTRGTDLPADITVANYTTYLDNFGDGINPVIYDTDGSIIDDLFGVGNSASVLGFAGSAWFGSPTCRYVEGQAVISGAIGGLTDAQWTVVFAHEIGHLIGLDHTQIDSAQGLASANWPLMYPVAYRATATLHEDDVSAVSALYPTASVATTYGTLSGTFRLANGTTPVRGANIWARETTTNALYSTVSSYLESEPSATITGAFSMLVPPGTYQLRAEAIHADFDNGSSVGPYSENSSGLSFQSPLYSSYPNSPMAPVTFGNGSPTSIGITAGCTANVSFRIDGTGSVGSNCVVLAASSTALSSLVNPSAAAQSVTFTATVTGGAGTPAGTVNFLTNGTTVTGCGTVPLNGSGVATCSTNALASGTHSITAVYSGNATYSGSTSSTVSQVVNKVDPATGLAASINPALAGQLVAFTAAVSGSAGVPTGSVDFRNGGASLPGCGAVAPVSGIAICNSILNDAGNFSITAVYSGNSVYNGATSAPHIQTILASPNTNVALASAGSVATSSSQYGPGYSAAHVINNERAGAGWGTSGGWNDGTGNSYPDWVQVVFNGSKTIDRVVVYTVQDNYASPVEPTDATTVNLYGLLDFTVQGWNGAAWVTLGTVSGNNLAKRTVIFAAFTTDRIRVNVTRGRGGYSRITEIEAWGYAVATNMALASAGATATASSQYGAGYGAANVINNERAGAGWGTSGGWNDGNGGAYPDWVQIVFNGTKTLERVVVYTVQDSYASPVEPTDATTVSLYGLLDFTVQGWNGAAWITLATVTGNTLAKRTLGFVAFTTDRIRVNVTNGRGGFSRLTEVEAFGTSAETNVALASAGATATSSSQYGAGYGAANVINNERAGTNWGSTGGWNDGNGGAYPDWVQIVFNGTKTLERVVVYTVQDSYASPVEPTDATTVSLYGLLDFTVQGWNGAAWVTLAAVTGNNLAKRAVNFSAFETDRIRVLVSGGRGGYSRITEIEAWGH